MAKYNPKIDLVFRKLFGSEENKEILKSLVNGVLNCSPKIDDLIIKNPYNLATYVGGKTSILDIKAVDGEGTWYDIELQIGEQGFYGKRALYYLSKMYVDQIEESEEYRLLRKTIGIHLIDFTYFPDERYVRHFVFKDMETNEYIEHLSYQQLYFIELNKFNKDWDNVKTLLDRWIIFLNKATKFNSIHDVPEVLKQEKELELAFNKLYRMNFTKEEIEIYDAERKQRMDAKEELRTAQQKGKEEGRREGKEEGRKEGLEAALKWLIESGISEDEGKKTLKL